VTRNFSSALCRSTSIFFEIQRTIFFLVFLKKHISTEIYRLDRILSVSLYENNWINELLSVLVEGGGRGEVLVQYEILLYLLWNMLLVAAAT
jgi:hypothetical protein